MAVPFSDIENNTTDIDQEVLNIENRSRANLFAWNGQFSPQFVEAILERYVNDNDVVYDPFLGSGTTLYECARKNISAVGTELNPSAYYISKIYELCNISVLQRQLLVYKIDDLLGNLENEIEMIASITAEIILHKESIYSNVLSLLVILSDIIDCESVWQIISNKWRKLRETILQLPFSESNISVFIGDSRKSILQDSSVNVVFTSPPYINVFNYHQKYRKSVELLGYNVLSIAKKELGSNRKNRGNRLLTVIQYCIDIALSISEMIRVGKEGARFIMVVGKESSVLGYAFSNSELIYRICCEVFKLEFLLKQQRRFKNRYGEIIYEDILHFRSNKAFIQEISRPEIICCAREIAIDDLKQKSISFDSNKNFAYLLSAINEANMVKESEE